MKLSTILALWVSILVSIPASVLAQEDREIRLEKIQPVKIINCMSTPVPLAVVVQNSSASMNFLWSTGQTDSLIFVKPLINTNYTVTVSNQDPGFFQVVSFMVTVENDPLIGGSTLSELPSDKCIGTLVTVSATHSGGYAPYTYQWPDGNGNQTRNWEATTTEKLFVTVTDACDQTQVSEVYVNVKPRIPVEAPQKVVVPFDCEGDRMRLRPSMSSVSGGVGYGYQFTFGTWEEAMKSFETNAEEGLTFPVRVTDACRQDVATIHLLLEKSPIDIPEIEDLVVCKRDTTDVVQHVPSQVYYWNGTGFRTHEHMRIDDDTKITLTYIDRCSDRHAIERSIRAQEPLAGFDYSLEVSTGRIIFENHSEGNNLTFRWLVNGVPFSEGHTPELVLQTGEISDVTLEVTDDLGCASSVSRRVVAIENISIPSAFSPNDDGKNDLFSLHIEEQLKSFQFEVFDRWGQLIYSTNDQYFAWDGKRESSALPIDTYVFKMKGETAAGETIEKFGTITILNN